MATTLHHPWLCVLLVSAESYFLDSDFWTFSNMPWSCRLFVFLRGATPKAMELESQLHF